MNYYKKYFDCLFDKIDEQSFLKLKEIETILEKIKKNKIIVVGNGGSSAIASHIAVDLLKSVKKKCLNLNEPSIITCFANDYGYENWVRKAIDLQGEKGDIGIFISSSGMSKNIVYGAKMAKEKKMKVITFSGFRKNNDLMKIGDINIHVNSNNYNFVENIHQLYFLSIIDKIAKVKID